MTSEITKALCGFYKDVQTITKDAKAQYGAFADLATVLSTVTPALYKNGLVATQTFEPSEGTPILITTLRHTSGESIESRLPMVIGSGRNILHDFGGSVTYLRRYSLLALLGLAADVDTDGELGEAPKEAAPAKAKAAPAKTKTAPAKPADLPTERLLSQQEKEELNALIMAMSKDKIKALVDAFAAEFKLEAPVASKIQTHQHAQFLETYMKDNA